MRQSISSGKSKQNKETSDKYFDEIRNENYEESFSSTEKWLRTANANLLNQNNTKPERTLSYMKNFFSANKFRLAYAFLILAFFTAACNYPVTQEETLSDAITWSVDKNNTDAISKIQSLDWFKSGGYNINEANRNGKDVVEYSLIVPKESLQKTGQYRQQLTNIAGVTDLKVTPLNETIKRPVYSALLNDVFKIDINASNKSDREVEDEIVSQLKQAGIEVATVNFEKGPDGERRMKLAIPEGGLKKDGGFDITVKDGNNVNRLKQMKNINPDKDRFKGKSDEEIRNMIREDFPGINLKDENIVITRKDGNVIFKINLPDEEGNKGEIELKTKEE